MPHLHLAFNPGEFIPLIGIMIPIIVLILGGAIAIVAIVLHHRRQALWHETARIALEKGQPMPAPPQSDEEREHTPPPGLTAQQWEQFRVARERSDGIRNGLILIGVGAGLALMLQDNHTRYVGAIPGFIGVAMLIHALLIRPVIPTDRPPQA